MNFTGILRDLTKQRQAAAAEVAKIDAVIAALSKLGGKAVPKPASKMSAVARKKIAAAQRARWAKWKAERAKK